MRLVVLFGPPAVGKTTVGTILESQTGYKLFHNHMIMDGVMHIFGVSTPAEDRLSRLIRSSVIDAAAETGLNLIFTYVWNFASDKGKNNIDVYKKSYESRGGTVYFVELTAELEDRVTRAGNPDRFKLKTHSPGPEEVRQLEETRNFVSPKPFFYPEIYSRIDTTGKAPSGIAEEIIRLGVL